MKTGLISFTLAALFAVAFSSVNAQAPAKSALPAGALHTIQDNAAAAQQNAHIYQWTRVNHEVDRVVAAAHSVEKALSGNTTLSKQSAEFAEAVRSLRSARLAHDADAMADAAQKLNAACDTLLKN